MNKRTIEIKVRLNEEEAAQLNEHKRKSGLSREAYIRQLLSGYIPRDAPPPDYFAMMRELHCIGRNLNQIAQKAHVLRVMDVQRYDLQVRQLEAAIRQITAAVILPQPIET